MTSDNDETNFEISFEYDPVEQFENRVGRIVLLFFFFWAFKNRFPVF